MPPGEVQSRAEPVLPSGLYVQAVVVPILPESEPVPACVRKHQRVEPTARIARAMHDVRVRPACPRKRNVRVSICSIETRAVRDALTPSPPPPPPPLPLPFLYFIFRATSRKPAFIFVIDTCSTEEELGFLRDSIQQALLVLPSDALVSVISYGTMVQVHEVAPTNGDCPRSFVFKGSKDYEPAVVASLLGLSTPQAATVANSRILVPVAQASEMVESVLSDMSRDPWPKTREERPARAAGSALSIAVSVLEKIVGRAAGRVMLFMSGPCTVGPGQIVDRLFSKETIRSHIDLVKKAAPWYEKAAEFYLGVANRASAAGHAIDIFTCSLDQVGLLEMKSCILRTGGHCVLADSFGQSVFKESFKKVFSRWGDSQQEAATMHREDAGHLKMGFGARMEVITSREFKIQGAIGPCVSLRKPSQNVSEVEVGEAGTCEWSLGAIDPLSTVAIYFDIGAAAGGSGSRRHHLQIITYYVHASGRQRMRVTTCAGVWNTDPSSLTSLAASFDQEAAMVAISRVAVSRTDSEDVGDIMRWLDRSLIRLCSKFAEYRKDDPQSFRLAPNFSIFPQFMFHLRRSKFMQTFNSSPDESAYARLLFLREDVTNSLVMIQPSLWSYGFNADPVAVNLDAQSVVSNQMLLLDTFFEVLVFHGEQLAQWREQKFHEQPEHEAFRTLLERPKQDATSILEERFPHPCVGISLEWAWRTRGPHPPSALRPPFPTPQTGVILCATSTRVRQDS